jgi:hypothetical protein
MSPKRQARMELNVHHQVFRKGEPNKIKAPLHCHQHTSLSERKSTAHTNYSPEEVNYTLLFK